MYKKMLKYILTLQIVLAGSNFEIYVTPTQSFDGITKYIILFFHLVAPTIVRPVEFTLYLNW